MQFRRIDVHAHANFAAYADDRGEVMRRALEGGTAVINVGTQADTSRSAVELARKYDRGAYAIIGLHPVHTSASFHDEEELGPNGTTAPAGFTSREESFDPAEYRSLLADPKVVGIGECGLDYYHHDPKEAEKQKAAFVAQIELANEFKKPLMLHVRPGKDAAGPNAYDDALEILRTHAQVKGNSHFFAGTIEQARKFLDLGCTMSFTGVITFAKQYVELVEYVPLDMMHAETDCPFVTPVPHRGGRNEPSYVAFVYEKIARIKKISVEEVERQLMENAKRMFGVDLS